MPVIDGGPAKVGGSDSPVRSLPPCREESPQLGLNSQGSENS